MCPVPRSCSPRPRGSTTPGQRTARSPAATAARSPSRRYIPDGAAGAIINPTVTQTVTSGYLKIYAAGTPAPGTSAVNWYASNQIVSNQSTVAVSLDRSIVVEVDGGHSTQFLVDVVGYLV